MTITEQLRDLLKRAAAPLNMDQIMEQLPDASRGTVAALLSRHKKAGEYISCVEDGRACWAFAEGYRASPKAAPKRFDKPTSQAATNTDSDVAAAPAADIEPIGDVVKRLMTPRKAQAKATPTGSQLEALRRAVSVAEAARDAYIDSLVEPRLYGYLQESVRTAREALGLFERGAA